MPTESWTFTVENVPGGGIECAGGLAIAVRSPRTDRSVTVMINPALLAYEKPPKTPPGIQLSPLVALGSTEDTRTFEIKVGAAGATVFTLGGEIYTLTLLQIGRGGVRRSGVPSYEFYLEHHDVDEFAEYDEIKPAIRAVAVYNRGVKKREAGDSEGAVADFDRVIDNPQASVRERAGALDNRAHIKSKGGDWSSAIDDMTAVLEMDDVPPAYRAMMLVNRAFYRKQNDEPDGAESDVEAVLEMPDAPEDQKDKARALLNQDA